MFADVKEYLHMSAIQTKNREADYIDGVFVVIISVREACKFN
jgi:hypothetical protein